jgi:two-component system, OmpR family, phosphate regulon sensor histidine kinase PhoR
VTPAAPQHPAAAPSPADRARAARIVGEAARARLALARSAVVAPSGGVPRDLVRVAAEELRVPATAIGGYLQLLLEGAAGSLEADQEQMLGSAAFHARRMVELVDDLVLIGNVAGRPARFRTLDVAELIRGRALDAAGRAVARQVRLELRLDNCPPLRGDAALIGRALECMLDHAITFSPPAGTVVCAAGGGPAAIVIEVSDAGIDPGPAALEALLDGRSDGVPDDPRTLLASRLGFALVRMVCEAHGGRAEARTGSGRTALRMVLPTASQPATRAARGGAGP